MNDENPTTRREVRRLTRPEIAKLCRIISESTEPTSDGCIKYTNGLTDAAVAIMIAPDLKASTIANFRDEAFGKLDTRPKLAVDPKIAEMAFTLRILTDAIFMVAAYLNEARSRRPEQEPVNFIAGVTSMESLSRQGFTTEQASKYMGEAAPRG